MKIEGVGAEYENCTINVGVLEGEKDVPYEVTFKDYVAEVPDNVGKSLIRSFPHFFPEGKVEIPVVEKEPHVFDETKYQQQEEKIISLQNSIKTKDQRIEEINAEKDVWKMMYEEMNNRFQLLSGQNNQAGTAPSQTSEEMELDTEEGYRKRLEEKNLDELKNIAIDLKVPIETVKKQTAKKSWIDAIINKTFKL